MWRDRTNLYISYRQSYSHHPAKRPRYGPSSSSNSASAFHDEERRGLISDSDTFSNHGGNDTIIEMDLLPPRWADVSDEVTDILADISRSSAKLDKLHQKHVLPGFDDNRDAEEGEIEALTSRITGAFHECQAKIRRVQGMVREGGEAGGTKAEVAMGRNIQISLATKVQDASTAFRKKQAAYLKKLRGLSTMSPLDRTPSPTPDSDPTSDITFSQSTLQHSATLTSNDAAIMQREREITDIARGIIELADIFKELQTMVIDQGTLLDRIDFNVERMSVHVREADKEMTVASGYQRRSVKRKVIMLLLLLVVGMIILLAIKPRSGGGGDAKNWPDPAAHRPPPIPVNDDPVLPVRGRRRRRRAVAVGVRWV